MTINVYIKFGEYYENLKIETPKQTNLTFYEYEYSHCEGKHISEALDIERDDWSSIYWVVNALRCYYPHLPYHFRDIIGEEWKMREDKEIFCISNPQIKWIDWSKSIEVIDMKRELKRIIQHQRPMKKDIGEAFSDEWITGKTDNLRMLEGDRLTMGEILMNHFSNEYVREGEEFVMKGIRGLRSKETGKLVRWKLGYEFKWCKKIH